MQACLAMSALSDNTPRWAGWLIRLALCVQLITKGCIVEEWWIAKPAATRGDNVNRSLEPIFELFAVEYRTGPIETGLNYYPHTSVDRETHAKLQLLHTFLDFVDTV